MKFHTNTDNVNDQTPTPVSGFDAEVVVQNTGRFPMWLGLYDTDNATMHVAEGNFVLEPGEKIIFPAGACTVQGGGGMGGWVPGFKTIAGESAIAYYYHDEV